MHLHEILDHELGRFDERAINIIETGTIRGRGVASEIGDGYSTLFFAKHVQEHGGRLVAIDLNTKTAQLVLEDHKALDAVTLHEGHSISWMAHELLSLIEEPDFDVAFLDSDNDPQLVFHEFLIAEKLVRRGGLIIVDDVRMDHHTEGEPTLAKKGDIVWPYVKRHGYTWRIHEREGWATYKTGVLVIEKI